MNRFETHVYATVRVKVLGTNFSTNPQEIAEKVADAVCASPSQWMRPVCGSVNVDGHGAYDIDAVEFADGISGVLVDEINPESELVVKEHSFDEACQPRTDETALTKATALVSTLYAALNDASSVVDPGDGEKYAYQPELTAARAFLGITDIPE